MTFTIHQSANLSHSHKSLNNKTKKLEYIWTKEAYLSKIDTYHVIRRIEDKIEDAKREYEKEQEKEKFW
jgi:hypothetical protein